MSVMSVPPLWEHFHCYQSRLETIMTPPPSASTHKKKNETKWYDSPSETQEKKYCYWFALSLAKLLYSTLLQSEATSALCWSPKRQRGTHTVPLLPCGTRSLWCEKKYVVSLCQSLAREATKKGKKEAVNSLFPAAGSFSLLFWFAVCALSVLLVMLIVSRPPVECDPFPGWVAVKLFAQADESACVLLLCACLQRGATMVMPRMWVCVWLCASGCISTDLHAASHG